MPSKSECIEALLAEIEERFYSALEGKEQFENFFGGRVEIAFTAKPRLEIDIHEIGKPGPKRGQKFRMNTSLQAARRLQKQNEDTEEL